MEESKMSFSKNPNQVNLGQRPMVGQEAQKDGQSSWGQPEMTQNQDYQPDWSGQMHQQNSNQPWGNSYQGNQNWGAHQETFKAFNSPLNKVGNLGVKQILLVIIAWLMFAGQMTSSLVIFGILCIYLEKDKEFSKSILAAIEMMVIFYIGWAVWSQFYSLLYSGVSSLMSNSLFSAILGAGLKVTSALSTLNGIVSKIYNIGILVVGLLSAYKVSKGHTVESKIVDKMFKVQL